MLSKFSLKTKFFLWFLGWFALDSGPCRVWLWDIHFPVEWIFWDFGILPNPFYCGMDLPQPNQTRPGNEGKRVHFVEGIF